MVISHLNSAAVFKIEIDRTTRKTVFVHCCKSSENGEDGFVLYFVLREDIEVTSSLCSMDL